MGDERDGGDERPDDVAGFVFGRDDAGDGAPESTGPSDGEVDSPAGGTASTTDGDDTSEAGDAADLFDPDAYDDGRTGGRRGSLVGGAVTMVVLLVALGYFTGPLVLATLSDVAGSGGPGGASPLDDRHPAVTTTSTTGTAESTVPAGGGARASEANASTVDRPQRTSDRRGAVAGAATASADRAPRYRPTVAGKVFGDRVPSAGR